MGGHQYYVYLLASKKNGTLYLGVTSNLIKRVYEHKNNLVSGFTQKYKIQNLVYYEATDDINSAITREKHTEEMEESLENRAYRKEQPWMERPLF